MSISNEGGKDLAALVVAQKKLVPAVLLNQRETRVLKMSCCSLQFPSIFLV